MTREEIAVRFIEAMLHGSGIFGRSAPNSQRQIPYIGEIVKEAYDLADLVIAQRSPRATQP